MGVAVVAAAVAGVLVWRGGDNPHPPPRVDARPAPTLQPLRVAEKPLWTEPGDVVWVEEQDGLMLFAHSGLELTLYDATTGTPRWTLGKMHDFGGFMYSPRLWGAPDERHLVGQEGVLVQYDQGDCHAGFCEPSPGHESGLVLVSATDGSIVWRTPALTFPEGPLRERPEPMLQVVDDRVAVVSVLTGLVGSVYDKGIQRNVAFDVRTGAKLWEGADGVWPMWIVGDTMLGVVSARFPSTWVNGEATGATIVATNLHTGEKQWERADSRLVMVAGDLALITDGAPRLTAVTADDGREVGSLDHTDRMADCRTDRTTLVACSSKSDGRAHDIVTFDVKRRKLGTATPGKQTVLTLDSVRGGRLWVTGRQARDPGEDRAYTIDSAGNEIDRKLDLPGDILLLTEDKAVLRNEDATGVYEILD
ncbi:PQQ-binding-like beta-propeller repeat protein [Actinophytocola sp.]|uniref:outer membrane protein assembly factor BamB family protein n=1 Tax=Actinophytocola sp. TaxID=1872138 RepID=UPI002ED5AAB2